jgi:hypothetical protein
MYFIIIYQVVQDDSVIIIETTIRAKGDDTVFLSY